MSEEPKKKEKRYTGIKQAPPAEPLNKIFELKIKPPSDPKSILDLNIKNKMKQPPPKEPKNRYE